MYLEWPTKDNHSIYKLNSVTLNRSLEQTEISRQTYSLLEWVGDIGGLYDGLSLLVNYFVSPFASFVLRQILLSENFSQVKKSTHSNSVTYEKIASQSCFRSLSCCFRKKNRYRRMLDRSESTIMRQLDMAQFLRQQKIQIFAILTLLSPQQLFLINEKSRMNMRESSELEDIYDETA